MMARRVWGTFDSEAHVLDATRALREAGYTIEDVYSPYAVHGLSEAMGLKPSRLTWVCFLAGLVGAALAIFFQFWTSAVDWPLNVGGKPFNSLPAFVPIAFEITILFAGLGVVAALFIRCGLWPGRRSKQPPSAVTDDKFVIALRLVGARYTVEDARASLTDRGAIQVDDDVEDVR